MPEIRHGTTAIIDIRHGDTPINEIRLGTDLKWSRGGYLRDDFARPNAATPGSDWTDHGPSTDHKIGILDGRARLLLPDGLLGGFWDYRISQYRYNVATLADDDGFVETRPASRGDSASLTAPFGYFTNVFGRLSDAAFTNGVGIAMSAGHLWIVHRTISLDFLVADCGTYQPGDTLRLLYAAYLFTMLKNGTDVGQWNDSGHTSSKASGFRSMGMRCDGAKDLLGPRRFSPSLEYVQMGAAA